MAKSIRQFVDEGFGDGDAEGAQQFLDLTIASLRETTSSVIRAVVFIFLLAGAFELLFYASLKSLSIGSLSFSNTALLQQFIPALVAFPIFDAYRLAKRHQELSLTCLAIVA